MTSTPTADPIAAGLPTTLKAARDGEVAILTLARTEKRNALNDTTVAGIDAFFTALPDDIKAVVLNGEGDHFSAGLDLSEVVETDLRRAVFHSRSWHAAFEKIQFGRVPVVSVLHGAVVGGGLELAAATHVRVAERSAYYGLPEGQRGIFVGGGGSVRIPRLVGVSRMMDMMLTGRTYSAEEGLAIGITQYVVDAGTGLDTGIKIAKRIATNAPMSNYAVIQALPRIAEQDMASGLMMESLMAAIAESDEEAKRRLRDFLEKRANKVLPNS